MQESWIQLQCPACEKHWEANPADVAAPDADLECEDCGETRPAAEFTKTARDLEILREFHGA